MSRYWLDLIQPSLFLQQNRHDYDYGAQLPNTVYFPPVFTDQNWRKPDRPGYMAAVERYHPALATVLDWERALGVLPGFHTLEMW